MVLLYINVTHFQETVVFIDKQTTDCTFNQDDARIMGNFNDFLVDLTILGFLRQGAITFNPS